MHTELPYCGLSTTDWLNLTPESRKIIEDFKADSSQEDLETLRDTAVFAFAALVKAKTDQQTITRQVQRLKGYLRIQDKIVKSANLQHPKPKREIRIIVPVAPSPEPELPEYLQHLQAEYHIYMQQQRIEQMLLTRLRTIGDIHAGVRDYLLGDCVARISIMKCSLDGVVQRAQQWANENQVHLDLTTEDETLGIQVRGTR